VFQKAIGDSPTRGNVNSILTKDGREREIEWYDNTLKDADGNLVGLVAIGYDVTERRQSQKALEESEQRFRTIVDNAVDGILLAEPETRRLSAGNHMICEMLGYTREEIEKLVVSDIHPREHLPYVMEQLQKQMDGELTLAKDVPVKKKDGSVFFADVNAVCLALAGKTYLAGFFRDVTERHEMDVALSTMADKERRRFGQDLHDGLGQELTGLGYLSGVLQDELCSGGHPQADMARQLTDGIQRSIRSVRSIAKGLVPVEVDAGGLLVALEQLAASTQMRTGISCRFQCDGQATVHDTTIATELYRIAQEGINNAVRHAKAQIIELRLDHLADGAISLHVRDDGMGLPDNVVQDGGLGLRIMQHRASLIGATLNVRAADGGGTEVVCEVPGGRWTLRDLRVGRSTAVVAPSPNPPTDRGAVSDDRIKTRGKE
jgi:PAS domain S-box-containing protein